MLGLGAIDYAQLRRMLRIARASKGLSDPGRGWTRFTLADIAAIEILIDLGGGRSVLEQGRRLVLGDIKETCDALRRLGFEDPLLQVPLTREGRRIVATINGIRIEPVRGQLVLDAATAQVDAFLTARRLRTKPIVQAIEVEHHKIRPRSHRAVSATEGFEVTARRVVG